MQHTQVEGNRCLDSQDLVFPQGTYHIRDGGLTGPAPCAKLGDHRIVMQGHLETGVSGAIQTHVTSLGSLTHLDHARRGHKVIFRVLRIDTAFQGMPPASHIFLLIRQTISCGHQNHIANQVHARCLLRHQMLHLKAGIHLEEIEVLVLIHHELQRPGTVVTDFLASLHRYGQHLLASGLLHEWRGRFLDHLLVTALDRALTLIQMDHVPIFIPEYLHLDMMGVLDILLDIDGIVSERVGRLGTRHTESRFHLILAMYQTHTLSTASGKRL